MTAVWASSPEYGIGQNDVAHFPPTLLAVRHIISFLQWRFSLLPAGAYHWAPEEADSPDGPTASEIYIAGDVPLPARSVGSRPAITVLRSQLAFQGIGIGDMVHHNWRTGGKTYMDLLPTTISISVLTRLPFVAERLAWFVQDQIFTMREEIIRTERCFHSLGARTTLTPPAPAGGLVDQAESDWIAVSLLLPVYLQHRTSFVPINVPMLDKINTETGEITQRTEKR